MKIKHRITLAATLAVISTTALAGVVNKAATGTDLTAGASWGGTAPVATDIATWLSSSLGSGLTAGSDVNWGAIDIEGALSAVDLSGAGTITLSGGQTVQGVDNSGIYLATAGQDLTIGNPITLGASQTWTVNPGRALTNSGGISGSGMDLTMGGGGTLTLSGNNTYDGATTVSGGTLQVAPGGVIATPAAALTINNGTLAVNGGSVSVGGVTSSLLLGASGAVDLSSGTLAVDNSTATINNLNTGPSTWTQSGGDFTVTDAGNQLRIGNNGAMTMVISGGTFTKAVGSTLLGYNTAGTSLTITNSGSVTLDNVNFCWTGTGLGQTATLNLDGGTFQVNNMSWEGNGGDIGTINFNGGTFKAGATFNLSAYNGSYAYFNTAVKAGGAIFDTMGNILTVSVPLAAGTPSGGLTKLGLGTLTLAANNTYTGATTISNGMLALSGSGSINSSSQIRIAAGGTFDVSALASTYTLSSSSSLSASGTGSGATAATINGVSGGTVNLGSQPITLTYDGSNPALYISQGSLSLNGNTFTINSASPLAPGTYTILQQASGSVSGSGTYSVTGTAIGSSSSGSISLSGGNVNLVIVAGMVATPVFSPPAGGYPVATNVTITCSTPGATIYYTTNGWATSNVYSAPISVPLPASMTIQAFGRLSGATDSAVVSAAYGTLATPIWINAAGGSWAAGANWSNLVVAAGTDVTADFGKVALPANATVTLDGARTIGNLVFGDQNATKHAWTLITGSGDPLTLAVSSGSPVISNNVATAIGAVLGGTQGVTKNGGGTLTLTNANTYAGGTTISGGTLELPDTAIANGAPGAATIGSNGVLELNTSLGSIASPILFGGLINGAGTLDVTGGGWVGLTSTASSLAGVINITGNSSLESWSGLFALTASVNIESGSGFAIGNHSAQCGALNGAGDAYQGWNSTAVTLTIGVSNRSGAFSGVIHGNGSGSTQGDLEMGTVALTKIGSGTQVLSGANTYSGVTTISGGTLEVDGSLDGGGAVTVSNADLTGAGSIAGSVTVLTGGRLRGSCTVAGAVEIQSGGTLSPGTTNLGTVTVNSALTLDSGSSNIMRISKTSGLVSNDVVMAAWGGGGYGGTLMVLNVTSDSHTLAVGDKFTLFPSTSGYAGAFSQINLPALATGLSWDLNSLSVDGSIAVTNQVLAPLFTPPAGGYASAVSVTISSPTPSATIHYTTDGTDPKTSGTAQSGPSPLSGITVPANTANLTIRAYATASGMLASAEADARYVTIPAMAWINDAGGSWAVPLNWTNGIVAGGRDVTADFSTLALANPVVVTLDGARNIGHMIFGDSGSNYTWELDNGSSGPLTLDATNSPSIAVLNQTTTIAADLAGTNGLTKTGNGMLVLSGANNTYTGPTTVATGILQAGATAPVFGINSALVLSNTASATLDLNSFNVSIGSLAGGGATGGNVTLGAGALTAGSDNTTTTYEGVISDSGAGGSFTKTGTGTLTLSGANNYSGATAVTGGTLQVAPGGVVATPAAALTINNGALAVNGGSVSVGGVTSSLLLGASGAVDLSSGTLAVDNSTSTVNNLNTGPSTWIQSGGDFTSTDANQLRIGNNGAMTMVISGGTFTKAVGSTFLGYNTAGTSLTITNTGYVMLDNVNFCWTGTGLGQTATLNLDGGTFQVNNMSWEGNGGDIGTINFNGGTFKAAGNFTLSSYNGNNVYFNTAVKVGGAVFDTGPNTLGVSVPLAAGTPSGGLTKLGSGTLALVANNTYTGGTLISNGVLALSGGGAINSSSQISIVAGGTFDVSALASPYNLSGSASVSASGTGTGATAAAIKGASGGTVNLGSRPITLTYDGSHPALYVTLGSLSLNGNSFTVNAASPLAPGTYTIIQQAVGSVSGSGTFSVAGTALGANAGSISVSGPNVNLVIAAVTTPPTLSGGGPLSGSSFPLTFSGPSGQGYQVLTSTNITLPMGSWMVLTTGTFGGNPETYTDTSATNRIQFYRIVSP